MKAKEKGLPDPDDRRGKHSAPGDRDRTDEKFNAFREMAKIRKGEVSASLCTTITS